MADDIDADGALAALLDAQAQLLSHEAELQRQTRHPLAAGTPPR